MSVYDGRFGRNDRYRTPGKKDVPNSAPCDNTEEKKRENFQRTGNQSGLLNGILPKGIDRDTLLIAALLFLLIKDGGDLRLILALGYILL